MTQPTQAAESTWRFTHWYPNKDDSKELKGEYMMRGQRKGSTLVLQSEPDATGAYVLVRLNFSINGKIAAGTWHENAGNDGEFEGIEYSGIGQMLVSEDGETLAGQWVGAGYDHNAKKLRLYTDKWEIVHVPDVEA